MAWYSSRFPKSMTVDERRAKALRAAAKLGRKQELDPVLIEGPLAATWWGKAWNRNLEGYADYSNRIPRGRSYARHGSVIDLRIEAGAVSALVQGSASQPYRIRIEIETVGAAAREALAEACSGKLDSAEALLAGRFPEEMERLLTAERTGLFPRPREIRFSCSCPDSASLCKHVAAALYGVGSRLDRDPSLFFRLRKVEMEELITRVVRQETRRLLRAEGSGESQRIALDDAGLGSLFGIDFEAVGGTEREAPIRTARKTDSAPERYVHRSGASASPGPGGDILRSGANASPDPGGTLLRTGAGKKGKPALLARKEIQSVLDSMESLPGLLTACRAELKALGKPRRGRKPPSRRD